VYTDFAINEAAVPVIPGRKSESEKFSGAINSFSIEAMMGDTRALQAGTSHFLGQNFARAFNIQFLDQKNQLEHVWTTSWGLSTRFIGAIIMTHGDDQGLILPPRVAPIQTVLVPIYRNDEEKTGVMHVVDKIQSELGSIRMKIDDREEVRPGFKFNEWEMKGVPLRVEVGPKDVENGTVALARRDIPGKEGRSFVSQENLDVQIQDLLEEIQRSIYEKAVRFRAANIHEPETYEDLKEIVPHGWAYASWCGDPECEQQIKADTKATTRCIPLEGSHKEGRCIYCGKAAVDKVHFARAY
jgi:prolyl-tRNA synthetase